MADKEKKEEKKEEKKRIENINEKQETKKVNLFSHFSPNEILYSR